MLLKFYIIEIAADGCPSILGPYANLEERRRAFLEMCTMGATVITLDTYTGGEAAVGRHHRDEES